MSGNSWVFRRYKSMAICGFHERQAFNRNSSVATCFVRRPESHILAPRFDTVEKSSRVCPVDNGIFRTCVSHCHQTRWKRYLPCLFTAYLSFWPACPIINSPFNARFHVRDSKPKSIIDIEPFGLLVSPVSSVCCLYHHHWLYLHHLAVLPYPVSLHQKLSMQARQSTTG